MQIKTDPKRESREKAEIPVPIKAEGSGDKSNAESFKEKS